MATSALINAPPKPTSSKESAPEVLSYRQRLYDRETLMLPNEPWNPAARLAQMRENYDRLVLELGVSPRGPARRGPDAGAALPRVPQGRHWTQGTQSARKSPTPRRVGYGAKAKGGGSGGVAVSTARLVNKLENMTESGALTAQQAKRLKRMWMLQEQLLSATGDEEGLLDSFRNMLTYLEEPDAAIIPALEAAELTEQAIGAVGDAGGSELPPPAVQPEPPAVPSTEPPPPPPPGRKPSGGSSKPPASPAAAAELPEKAAPPPDPDADAAFSKVQAFLSKDQSRISELFRKMDSNLDGAISTAELALGLQYLGLEMDPAEIAAFLRRVNHGDSTDATSLKTLARALRPGQSVKALLRKPDEAAQADQPISAGDMIPDGMTEDQANRMRAEAHLKAGRLPSLSPDEEDDGSPRAKKGAGTSGANQMAYVWNQIETRLAPDGVSAAPNWQREALHRVQWQVDVKRRKDAREAKLAREAANPQIPAWDKPTKPRKKQLLERELRQQRTRVADPSDGDAPASASTGGLTPRPPPLGTQSFGGGASSFSGSLTGGEPGGGLVGDNPARKTLRAADPEDTSRAHAAWLRQSASEHDDSTTHRVNKVAFYEQALQQLQLQKQELDHALASTKSRIDGTQRSGEAQHIDTTLRNEHFRRHRLKADLLEVQTKANAMTTSTQALMHVINSLRITRKRHVQRVCGLDTKEKTLESDSQFLLSSASGAMEERERLRSKHERLKHEAAAWRTMQLKEAEELGEKLESLDVEYKTLKENDRLLDEQLTMMEFQAARADATSSQRNNLKYGYLRGQVAGWSAEFERVTAITGVRFGEGKSDAVDKVVSIYSANELRNKSLFKFVTEDIVVQTETLTQELAAEEAMATKLEGEQKARDDEDANASAAAIEEREAATHLVERLETTSTAVDAILPLIEKFGMACLDAAEVGLPQHMEGKAIGPPQVPPFLELLEDALHTVFNKANGIVTARAPKVPETEEEIKEFAKLPPEEVSDTLATLRSATQQRTLASGKDAAKMLHNDSSERLLSMS